MGCCAVWDSRPNFCLTPPPSFSAALAALNEVNDTFAHSRGRGRAGGEAPRPRGRPRGCPRRGLTWRDRRLGDDDNDNRDDDNDIAAGTSGPSTATGPAGRARGHQGARTRGATRGAPSNRGGGADPHSPCRAGSAARGRGMVTLHGTDASTGDAARDGGAAAWSWCLVSRRRGVLPACVGAWLREGAVSGPSAWVRVNGACTSPEATLGRSSLPIYYTVSHTRTHARRSLGCN